MKKLLLSLGAGLVLFFNAQADDYIIYKNGNLPKGIEVYGWWNADFKFDVSNPSTAGAGQVFQFQAAGTDGYEGASMGLNQESRINTGVLADATLNFDWYAVGSGTYTIRLTCVSEENYTFNVEASQTGKWNTMKLNVPEIFPKVSKEWDQNLNNGVGYVFSVILTNGKEGDVIYFNNIFYSDINMEWEASEPDIQAPETVPVPTQNASDVLSVFSSSYTPATTFNIGYWGQTTNTTLQTIDNQQVYYLRNFNYLGWELNSDIDVSGYDYMHVDFWTAVDAPFGFTPISRGGSHTEKSIVMSDVVLNEWNQYDIALSEWSNAGLDLSKIFQIKFDQGTGAGDDCYIANVYFWKGEGSGDDNGGDDNNDKAGAVFKGSQSGTYTQTMSADDVKTYDYIFNYDITYNEDKTLTIIGSFDWPNGTPAGATDGLIVLQPGLWVQNGTQGEKITTEQTFEEGTSIDLTFQSGVALGNVETVVSYVVGSSSEVEGPGDPTGIISIDDFSGVDIYTLSGIRVAKGVDFNEIKNTLSPGLYIVGGKKVIVK